MKKRNGFVCGIVLFLLLYFGGFLWLRISKFGWRVNSEGYYA